MPPGAMNAGLHGADRHLAGARRLSIGEARSPDHCHSVALNRWQLLDRLATFLQLNTIDLFWWRGHHERVVIIDVFDFALALAIFGEKMVAQDGAKPGHHGISGGARRERVEM